MPPFLFDMHLVKIDELHTINVRQIAGVKPRLEGGGMLYGLSKPSFVISLIITIHFSVWFCMIFSQVILYLLPCILYYMLVMIGAIHWKASITAQLVMCSLTILVV